MEQTKANITWPQFIEAFRKYAKRFAAPPSKKLIADMEHKLKWFYPSIVSNPSLILSIEYSDFWRRLEENDEAAADDENSGHGFKWGYEHYRCYSRIQAFARFQKINRDIDEDQSDIHSTFSFTVTHVMECFKRHMQKSGWKILSDRPINGEVKRLTARAENNEAETFYAEGIGTAWTTSTRPNHSDVEYRWEQYVRVDKNTIKRRFQKIFYNLLDAKIENRYTSFFVVFANDTATSEILAPYFPYLKSLGFGIFGVKSAEEVVEI
jgi:hypothetical protein